MFITFYKFYVTVIKSKGKAYGYFTNFISNEAIETEIKKQVIKKLKESLVVELKDNGIKSIIRIK